MPDCTPDSRPDSPSACPPARTPDSWLSRRTAWTLAGLGGACALAAGAVLLSGASRAADEPKTQAALTVNAVQPQRSRFPLRLAANGNVAAWQEASIGAEGNGLRLTGVLVNVGDRVAAGQLLATFSDSSVHADLAQAQANLFEAQANAGEARANASRARTLEATGALSQQQIDQFMTAGQTAQARVMAAQAGVDAQRLRLAHTRVLAPDSGVISARTATVGAVVSAGNELFRMLRRGRLEWRAEVTASELHRIQPGIKVRVTPAGGTAVEGSVRMLAPTVDPQTRNALVYVDLPAHAQLRAGMFARGEFALGDSEALTVPQEALVLCDGFAYVFVLDARQRVQQRKVQTGRRVADRVEVLSGLDAQASIAVRGAGFLNDGDLVRVVAAAQDVRQSAPAAPAGLSPRGAQ
ncbi:efflux RND transporter periplasmic adaptor subunit [Verminephrobacter aporrectodeae subsp. tuberculatae]|uniref:efflux RND transporter periplasmic adaptor subunit n=1 Tax=Verminephrobacter aporrectodeae TaxID=1110389 RepID=UPI0022384BC4|nr:efflux RND transporter periplasmic adaptor subunit [Verminephrobacter aporrectodeae]MCW5254934.1 efflux RND transporter periplasmic adaptor subunit [Verminephrobacter aporrectodeae subsp. tuberculatae]